MERESKNENEKTKEAEKKTEVEDDETEDYDDEEAMESFGEESHFQAPTVVSCVPSITVPYSTEESEDEVVSSSAEVTDTYAERREKEMKLRWMSVTGKKPLTIPKLKIDQELLTELPPLYNLFGEKRPYHVEKARHEHWLKMKKEREARGSYRNEGKIVRELRMTEWFRGIRCVRLSPKADSMVITAGNGVAQIRRTDTGEVKGILETVESGFNIQVMTARYHPRYHSKVYLGGAAGIMQVFDVNQPKAIGTVRQKFNEICNLDFSPDGSLCVTVGKDASIYIYDSQKLRLVSLQRKPPIDEFMTSEIDSAYHEMRIYALKYHPTDPNIYVTGGWDNTVKVWDTRTCGCINSILSTRICGDSIDLRGTEILTGSWSSNNSLKIWDLSSGKLIRNIAVVNSSSPIDGEFVYVVKYFPGSAKRNMVAVGGNGYDEVRVINVENSMPIAKFPAMKAVTALDVHRDTIVYGGMESLVRIGELENERDQLEDMGSR